MARALRFFLLLSFLAPGASRACTYMPVGNNIFEAIRAVWSARPDLFDKNYLVRGRVTERVHGYGIRFTSDSIYIGRQNLDDTVTVWGDPGSECRAGVAGIRVGDTAIILLFPLSRIAGSYEKMTDYFAQPALWGVVYVHNDSVFGAGNATGALHLPLSGFEDSIANIVRNAPPPTSVAGYSRPGDLKLFPNPAGGMLRLELGGPVTGSVEVSLSTLTGQIVQQQSFFDSPSVQVSVAGLAPGLYHCTVHAPGGVVYRRLFQKE